MNQKIKDLCSIKSLYILSNSTNPSSPLIIAFGQGHSENTTVATIQHAVCTDESVLKSSDFFVLRNSRYEEFFGAILGQKVDSIPYQTSNQENATTITRKNKRGEYTHTMLDILNALDIAALEFIRTTFFVDTTWFRTFVLLFSDSEPILFSIFLVALWGYGMLEKHNGPKHVALDLFWHVFGAFALYWILNTVLPHRPRPELFTSLPPLIDHLPDNSFPSGHAMFWGASWWALHVLLDRPRVTMTFFILGGLTCFARIVAGIHYPGDILVGFFLGWGIVHVLTHLPHGDTYQRFAHDIPLRITRYFGL